jgi:integrase
MSALPAERPARPDTPRGVEPVPRRADGGAIVYRFRTRWKDPVTGRRVPSPVYDTVAEVETFRALQTVARARGDLVKLTTHATTLEEFAEVVYWRRHAPEFKSAATISSDRSIYRNHICPQLGHVPLRRLTAPVVEDYRDRLTASGRSRHVVRRALVILSDICGRAVVQGVIVVNPVREIRKPSIPRRDTVYTPSAAAIEALRRELDVTSAALVSVLGYEGLRPNEALALEERHLLSATLTVAQRAIDGRIELGLKNSGGLERHSRSPALYQAVREDLDRQLEHRGPADGRAGHQLVFPGAHGQPWTVYEYRRWREKVLAPAAERAGVPLTRPYDLRHGCASMLLYARRPLTEIGRHMGHTISTLDRYYAHLIENLKDADPIPVQDQIAAARSAHDHPTGGDTMRQTP